MVANYSSSCSPITALVIIVFSIYLSTFSLVEAGDNGGGFSVDIIHRDSMLSPSYDPSVTHFERQQNAFRRSLSRVNNFKQSLTTPNQVSPRVIPNGGSYLMEISFGTPPMKNLAIVDTGSDLIWIQCKPCQNCYKQKAPLFDPTKSSTYREISCKSKQCQELGDMARGCSPKRNACKYLSRYGDGSFTNGLVANETFTLGSTSGRSVPLPNKMFGCGHNNDGTFGEKENGIVGLGESHLSLISQLKSSIDGMFSYCLVPLEKENVTSKLYFGSQAVVSGDDVVSTPLVSKNPVIFYYVTLEGISVGNQRLEFKKSWKVNAADEGNTILDSGSTLTFLQSELYDKVESEVSKLIGGYPVPDPEGSLSLCYKADTDVNVPITVHFSGADLKLKQMNTFVRISEELICFAFAPIDGHLAVFGNIAQMDFLVGYDLQERKVYFKPADCSKY
ncbi:aspartic proteinase CDR1-like [Macadamia integrifolia]|uniref:aspartic proteinase CDR1-like n=1 Tax=Macadamia integrifolia TaxID=60698 RepID=UPI001C4FC787|nr:aspartic proteinase CDR1-like [Macadamia integrifolia]